MTDPITLFWLNSFSLLYLLLTSAVLLRNRLEFTPLRHQKIPTHKDSPKISVCVPARNEELNIVRVLTSVCNQNYSDFELLVLDDHSTDNTSERIHSVQGKYPGNIRFVPARDKPQKWLGKQWACQQLAEHATGDVILFIDADTRLFPDTLSHIAGAFDTYNLDMITVWPEQETQTFWEKMIIPLIYYALLTFLPAIYVYRPPRWIPFFLEKKINPMFAAACGQCIGFTSDAYQNIGGHRSVKQSIVEDVQLSKIAKRKGLIIRMFEGVGSVSCRMYRSEREIFSGLRKNFFAGFGRSVPIFITMAAIHLIVFVLPFITLPYSLYLLSPPLIFLTTASVSLILLHRFILAIWFKWNPIFGILHPVSVLWFQWLALVTIGDHFFKRKIKWKGRDI